MLFVFGALLGISWAYLGPSRAILGLSCAILGYLGLSWAFLVPSRGHLGLILGYSWPHLGLFLALFAAILGPLWASKTYKNWCEMEVSVLALLLCALALFLPLLALSCGCLGHSWGYLGPSWALLGAFLGPSWALLGRLGAFWRPSTDVLNFGRPLRPILGHLGPSWASLAHVFFDFSRLCLNSESLHCFELHFARLHMAPYGAICESSQHIHLQGPLRFK
jgi:hypothetical protein